MLQLVVTLLLIISLSSFALMLILIQGQLCEKLVALFNPFVWVGVTVLKWFWREPKRYKEARGAEKN
jgi:hypothetical protein